MILGINLGPIVLPEVDNFLYLVDICFLNGFLSPFSEKDWKNGIPLSEK